MIDQDTERVEESYLWGKRHEALYRTQLSSLYHRKRERFFSFWDRSVTAVAIVGGSAAFAGLGGPNAIRLAAAAIALTSTIGLVFAFAERARRHSELARQFLDLERAILRRGARDFTEADTTEWGSEIRILESSEPPSCGALVQACQNELAQASGAIEYLRPLSWWGRLTKQFRDQRVSAT